LDPTASRTNLSLRPNQIIDSNNLGAFYSFVNKRLSHKSGITVVTDSNGDIANAFTDYFASVGVPSNHSTPHCRNPEVPSLHSIDVSNTISWQRSINLKITHPLALMAYHPCCLSGQSFLLLYHWCYCISSCCLLLMCLTSGRKPSLHPYTRKVPPLLYLITDLFLSRVFLARSLNVLLSVRFIE